MVVKLVANGEVVRAIYNVQAIEEPNSVHPASWWFRMQTSDKPQVAAGKYLLLVAKDKP